MEKIPATKARQGRKGTNVLIILVTALILAGIVWFGLGFYGESIDTREDVPAETGTTDPAAAPTPAQ